MTTSEQEYRILAEEREETAMLMSEQVDYLNAMADDAEGLESVAHWWERTHGQKN